VSSCVLPAFSPGASPLSATSFEPATAKAFGDVVRSLREEQGVAEDQFALLAVVDRSYDGKLERGERWRAVVTLGVRDVLEEFRPIAFVDPSR